MRDGTENPADRPVGFFDSGVGGKCILEAFRRLCPAERTVYIADTRHCPYGNRPPEEVSRLSEACVQRLLRRNCKLIVVACNTATAAAIRSLRAAHPDVPFVGVEPALKPAAARSKSGVVGVLATAGTFKGGHYAETKAKFAAGVRVVAAVADDFVRLVERGVTSGAEAERTVRARIEPLLAEGADEIVLGCTHFPHLKPVIEKVCAGRAEVLDPSDAVARQARRVLAARGLLRAEPAATPARVALHACCGPCASACVPRLRGKGCEVALVFANSNIDTRAEFEKRRGEAEKLARAEGVPFAALDYDHGEWLREVAAGFEGEPEGGERCRRCFRYNLARAAAWAAKHGFDAFTTSLTVSPHKSSAKVFAAGREAATPAVKFLEEDFKKKSGFLLSVRRAKELGLYRQAYCGCEFTRRTQPGVAASP